ncbi:glycosyltransferase [Bacillus sp. SCS-153A]|uniref:glycosyltransferase n=1 Tax=Rossellomorea sedimentorum TaxID=3115294 RepID=UPI003905F294
MKVLLLAPANNVHTKKWLEYYNSIGIKVVNVSLENHRDMSPDCKLENVDRIYLDLKINHKISYILTVSKLKKIIKKENPDILHSHYASSYGLIGALAKFSPFVISVWGSDIYDFPNKNVIAKATLQFALQKADYICATSPALERETKKYLKEEKPLYITPFGVDVSQFKPRDKRPVNNGGFKIGIAKRMEPKYGIEYLLEGYKLFLDKVEPEKRGSIELLLAGEGAYTGEYKRLAEDLGIRKQVKFLGRIEHEKIPDFISSLHVVVVSSLIESFGVSAVEAQACGVPVIATNVGGLPEVVIDRESGYIVPSEDPESIADRLYLLYTDPSKQLELGRRGREHVLLNYDWTENSKRMSDLYEQIARDKGEFNHEFASK